MSADQPTRTAARWAQASEVGAVAGMWFLFTVNRVFGRWPFRVLLAPVVFYYLVKQQLARSASRQYFERLQAHTGALGHAPGWRDTFRHITLFAETLLDKALAASGRFQFQDLAFEGRELMFELIEKKQGGVLLTAHLGCLEVMKSAAERRGHLTLNVLVHTKHAERFNSVLKRLDPKTSVRLIQVSDLGPATAMMLAAKVEAGEFLVIAGDRVPVDGKATTRAKFLGAEAPFPIGPYVLAHALKCPVVLFTTVHRGDSYLVQFEKFRDRVELPRGQRDAALAALASDYAARLEARCTQAPYDWFNFFDFWNSVGP